MRSERETEAIETILTHAAEAQAFLQDMDRQAFSDDRRTFHAVTRCIEIISEASRRLSPELKGRHPEIPWQAVAGVGNVYRHDYENISADAVYKTVQVDLPLLQAAINAELGR